MRFFKWFGNPINETKNILVDVNTFENLDINGIDSTVNEFSKSDSLNIYSIDNALVMALPHVNDTLNISSQDNVNNLTVSSNINDSIRLSINESYIHKNVYISANDNLNINITESKNVFVETNASDNLLLNINDILVYNTALIYKVNGNWKNINNVYVKINGRWKPIIGIYGKVNDVWKVNYEGVID